MFSIAFLPVGFSTNKSSRARSGRPWCEASAVARF